MGKEYEDRIPVAILDNGYTISIVHTKKDRELANKPGIGNCSYLPDWDARFPNRTHIILLLADKEDVPRANINCGNADYVIDFLGSRKDGLARWSGGRDCMYYTSFVDGIGARVPRKFWEGAWYPLEFLSKWNSAPSRIELMEMFKAWYEQLPMPTWAIPISGWNNLYATAERMKNRRDAAKPKRDRLGRFSKKEA